MSKKTCKDYTAKEIISIARAYLYDNYTTLYHVAHMKDTTEGMISKLLFRGIAEGILSDSLADKVYAKIVNANPKGIMQRKLRWNKAFDARYNLDVCTPNKLLFTNLPPPTKNVSSITEEKEQLKSMIESYDDYFFDEEGAPTKRDLQKKLAYLILAEKAEKAKV